MNSDLSDEHLMSAYVNGDQGSFAILFERYKNKIYGFLHRRLGSKSRMLVDDLFQLTWLKLHQSRASFNENKLFSTWIFTIAQNSMLDHLKKSSSKFESADDLRVEQEMDPSENVEEKMIRIESSDKIDQLLLLLPDKLREAIVLCDLEELPSKEVAIILNINDVVVRQRLFKARKKLRELVEKEKGGII